MKIVNCLFALALHLAIGTGIYRKYVMLVNWLFWYPYYTGFLILQHHFFVIFYWIGDWEPELFFLPKFWYIYIFFFFLYFILFLQYFIMYYYAYFSEGFMPDTTYRYLDSLQDIWKNFFINILKHYQNDFLKQQWYLKQLNTNKWYKLRFQIFIKLTSIICIIIYLAIYLFIIYLCYYLVHKWTSAIFIEFERNFFYILLNLLNLWFIYNFYISLFFNSTSIYWIFLIVYVGDTLQKVEYPLLSIYAIEEIIDIYAGGAEIVMFFDAVTVTALEFSSGKIKPLYFKNPKKKLILFNKKKYEFEEKHIIPKPWHNWSDICLSCYIPNNYYYIFALNWFRIPQRYLGIDSMILSRYYTFKKSLLIKKWISWKYIYPYADTFCIFEYPAYKDLKKTKKIKKYKLK